MEDIQKLQQDNAKLTERLNNAAKFFREQKAQIEELTNEVKEKTSLAMDYRNQIEVLTKENEESNADVINNYAEEIEKYKKNVDLLNKSIDELNNTITSKDTAYKVLQNTYNEIFGENTKLKEDLENHVKQIQSMEAKSNEELKKVITTRDEYITKYNSLVTESENLTSAMAKVESDNDLLRKNISEKDKLIKELKADNDELNKQNYEYNNHINELENTLSKTNELFNNCENEKYAVQADLDSLQDKYTNLELKYNKQTEIIKSYENENNNVCKYTIDDINELCGYIADYLKDKNINKE